MKIATLFNLFCPLFLRWELKIAIFIMIIITRTIVYIIIIQFCILQSKDLISTISTKLFPSTLRALGLFVRCFIILTIFNLISLVCFSFPITTTLSFNMSAAILLWIVRILLFFNKKDPLASLLPSNSPWYLVPFLSLVELIRIVVRPITLCFRLLANIRAGHILLFLICKLPKYTLLLGRLFRVLELIVRIIQSFVFVILVRVYLEESIHTS